MENPHEQEQKALLARIIGNVQKLNESIQDVNQSLSTINHENVNIELVAQMWETYEKNVKFQLENVGQLQKPFGEK